MHYFKLSILCFISISKADYLSNEDLFRNLEYLNEQFPHLSRIYSIGKSAEGRDLKVNHIRNGIKFKLIFIPFLGNTNPCKTWPQKTLFNTNGEISSQHAWQ